jgi:hypothetical protein
MIYEDPEDRYNVQIAGRNTFTHAGKTFDLN